MNQHVIDALKRVDSWSDDQIVVAAATAMLEATAPETLQLIVARGESEFVNKSTGMHIASRALESSLRSKVFHVLKKKATEQGLIHG